MGKYIVIRLFKSQKLASSIGRAVLLTYLNKSQTGFQCRVSVSHNCLLMALINSSGYHCNQVISLIDTASPKEGVNGTTWCRL